LGDRLRQGADQFPVEFRVRHRDFLWSLQHETGGWAGREGDPDLYYTGFAIRSLAMLQGLEGVHGEKAAEFLRANATGVSNIIDLLSWLYSALAIPLAGGPFVLEDPNEAWVQSIAVWLESFRHADGGYSKTLGGTSGSTYHTFLAVLCHELLGHDVPEPQRVISFLSQRIRDDGGFVEIPQMKYSGTNPTAAGLACWGIMESPPQEVIDQVAEFLRSVTSDEGGFQANVRIPFADGLSTFTAWHTVLDFELTNVNSQARVRQYALGLEKPIGGFLGASLDSVADVEYTFYGLGTLALTS
jgi:geranylgeranyl transferase type-2 subunit beta